MEPLSIFGNLEFDEATLSITAAQTVQYVWPVSKAVDTSIANAWWALHEARNHGTEHTAGPL